MLKKLKILTGEDNPILRAKSVEIKNPSDKKYKALAKAMVKTMKTKGVGLAAPQIGENIRMFVISLDYGEKTQRNLTVLNPKILWESDEEVLGEEGCLSLPGIYEKVWRSERIKVSFQDLDGNEIIMDLDGWNAREFLHEFDHLEGVLFIDRIKDELLVAGEGELNA